MIQNSRPGKIVDTRTSSLSGRELKSGEEAYLLGKNVSIQIP